MVPERRKDFRRRAAVDIALALAELNAGWDDYSRALEHLSAADELSGGAIGRRFGRRRDEWRRRVRTPAEGARA